VNTPNALEVVGGPTVDAAPAGDRPAVLSPRRAFKGLGSAAAAGSSLVGFARRLTGRASSEGLDGPTTRQWGLLIDLRRCDGCRECTVACQRTHHLPLDQQWIKVYELEEADGRKSFMPRPCMQCERPPCLKACPVHATFRNKGGVVLIDQQRCIGCRACLKACPYDARSFNLLGAPNPSAGAPKPRPEFPVPQRPRTVGKCTLCVSAAEEDRLPACVDGCRADALYLVDLTGDVMTGRLGATHRFSDYARENAAFRFKEELNTGPRVWYVGDQHPCPDGTREPWEFGTGSA